MFNQLEGDGVIDNLYHLLWTKDSIFENCKLVFYFIDKTFILILNFYFGRSY